MSCKVYLNDSLKVTLTLVECGTSTPIDVSTATTQEIILAGDTTRIPAASSFVTDGTDGQITANIASNQIDELGKWQVQGHVILPGPLEYHSEITTFVVEQTL